MSEIQFGDNYSDHCVSSGVNAGFQFEFRCERCGDAWRTDFVPYRGGQAAGWLGRASGLLGGMMGQAENLASSMAQSGWGTARDDAFREAVEKAKVHFQRCAHCHQNVCARCWNAGAGLCLNCAPDAQAEIESSRAQGLAAKAGERARAEGESRGETMDVKTERQLVCPKCHAETHGAKFCPECGTPLGGKSACVACKAEIEPGTKFCPECGAKQAAA